MTWKIRIKGVALILFTCGLGCGERAISRGDLVGEYTCDYKYASERLTVLADGTFMQQISIKHPPRGVRSSGRWTWDESAREVVFDGDFCTVVDGFGRELAAPQFGNTVLPVIRTSAGVQIGDTDLEQGGDYHKVR